MSDQPAINLVCAMPVHTADREKLRRIIGHPLPSIYPDSTAMPCTVCGMTLAVGPRSTDMIEAGLGKPYCPICVVTVTGGDVSDALSLGNPNAGWEKA